MMDNVAYVRRLGFDRFAVFSRCLRFCHVFRIFPA